MTYRFRRAATIVALCVLLAPCAGRADDHDDDHGHDAAYRIGAVVVDHPWARAAGGPGAEVYFELRNGSPATVAVVSAKTARAESARFVATWMSGGRPSHEPVPALDLAAGDSIVLAPDGLFLRLEGLASPLREGDAFPLTLVFRDLGSLDLTVEVAAADATEPSHAGHHH